MPFTAKVISTKDWGALPPKEWAEENRPQYIVIHHTATPNPPNDASEGTLTGAKEFARSIQYSHMYGFGWADSGHNFLNTTGGFLLEGRHGSLNAVKRGRSVRGAHAGTTKGNESPGIENEGTFTTYQMKAAQWNSLVDLCASICSSCNIDPNNIKGHRDFIPTQCPGDWLYSQLSRLRSDVRKRLGAPLPVALDETLREGSIGTKVKELQQLLKTQGFNPGPIDGIFGSGTVKTVIAFQKFKGLVADGVVGPLTWKALRSTPPKPKLALAQPSSTSTASTASTVDLVDTYKYYRGLPHQEQAIQWLGEQVSPEVLEEFSGKWRTKPPEPFLPLQEGAIGPEVKQVQQRLQEQGFYQGTIDGIFGVGTKAAAIAFQQSKGLVADGIVSVETWTTLNIS